MSIPASLNLYSAGHPLLRSPMSSNVTSSDGAHRRWPLIIENKLLSIDNGPASGGHRHLFDMIQEYAPHLRASFVNCETWWNRNWGTPEAHVRFSNGSFAFVGFVLTLLQMFKHLLYRGMEDILIIFNAGPAVPPEEIRKDLCEANSRAEPVWNDKAKTLSARRARCKTILDPVVARNSLGEPGEFRPFPSKLAPKLDAVFSRHYKSHEPDRFLLIGKTEEDAYRVQEEYVHEVGLLLGSVRQSYRSRAITQLGKVYGRSSMPLLSISSVSALWLLCQTTYYKKQLSLVSRTHSRVDLLADSSLVKLHRWVEPFAESLGTKDVGCDYVSSMDRIFKPNEDEGISAFVMVWFPAV